MYELVDHIENLTFFADRMSKQNKSADPTLVISDATLGTTRWMTKEELTKMFFEEIKDTQVVNNPKTYQSKIVLIKNSSYY